MHDESGFMVITMGFVLPHGFIRTPSLRISIILSLLEVSTCFLHSRFLWTSLDAVMLRPAEVASTLPIPLAAAGGT